MTAFASGEAEIGNLTLHCDIRSVNHRYCDIFLRLPEGFRFVEAEMRSSISQKLKRGKIECSVNYKKQSENNQTFTVNLETVKSILAATADIELQMQNNRPFSALDILMMPGVQQESETDKEHLRQGILNLLEKNLTQLLEVREREGHQLGLTIEERCNRMRTFVESAKQRMPEVLQNLRNKLTNRIHELVPEPDFDRLEQELVFLVQKLDIDEELDRLETHINEVLRVLKLNEPIGRRLDFLMQEMNREANTLGSKSADKEMTQISIELKVLIEQMREQIQNIE